MSLGLGIFLSAILLIIVWQIDKHGAWRKAGKAMLWLLTGFMVLAVGAYLYWSWWPIQKEKRELADQVAVTRNPTGLTYWGIKIGMKKAEVKYLKGEPSETSLVELQGIKHEVWDYKVGSEFSEHTYQIYWNAANTEVRGVSCGGGSLGDCETMAGVGIQSTEADVLAILGKPLREDEPSEAGTKYVRYGNRTDEVRFSMSRGAVKTIILVRPEKSPEQGAADTAPPTASSPAH
jgi:hypothetical protein